MANKNADQAGFDLEAVRSQLPALTTEQLVILGREIESIRQQRMSESKTKFIEETTAKAAELGLSINDLFPSQRIKREKPGKSKGGSVPKYEFPDGIMWSGLGRPPKILKEIEERGETKEKYLINKI